MEMDTVNLIGWTDMNINNDPLVYTPVVHNWHCPLGDLILAGLLMTENINADTTQNSN